MALSELSSTPAEDSARQQIVASEQQATVTEIVERPVQASSLPSLEWHDICRDYYNGNCRLEDQCPRNHTICHVQGVSKPSDSAPLLYSRLNRLSLLPRLPHDEGPFDDTGPADLNLLGPRHNNDFSKIHHIRILPTTDEVLSQRRPFMPPKEPASNPHHQSGVAGMLDVQFRHLRYDTFEPVIDACYHASQQLASSFANPPSLDYEVRQRTARGTQYSLFRDVRLEDVRFEREGIHLRLSFACPIRLRQRHLLSSGHFESGMLMALIGLDSESTLSTTFCKAEMCQSTLAMRPTTGNHLRAAVVASFADPLDTGAVREALQGLKGLGQDEKFVIVEFPSVLVAGYHWILKHLQHLSSNNAEISFSDLIAPSGAHHDLQVAQPTYPGIEGSDFDLSMLQNTSKDGSCPAPKVGPRFLEGAPTERNDLVEGICSATTLDRGQATALCETLTRGLAFTLGPPGTGKTFFGVSLAKVILKHMPKKPILVACMTNHALDNFLGELIKQGITKVARLGSGSKEDWIGKHTMASLRKNSKMTCGESTRLGKVYRDVECLAKEGAKWCEALNSHTLTWTAVRDHLEKNYWSTFNDFNKCLSRKEEQIEDVRQRRSAAGGFAFEHWCKGGDLKGIKAFARDIRFFFGKTQSDPGYPVDSSESEDSLLESSSESSDHYRDGPIEYPCDTFSGDVWSLPMHVRAAFLAKWKAEIGSSSTIDKLTEVQRRYIAARERKQEIHNEVDARYLASQEVIGMTTTACAKYWSMLKSLHLQTLICEEAGEIMEAQTITTLLPSIAHAIFIGDPLQLRPQIDQQCLSLETTYGFKYRLDESLFERMVMPRAPGAQPLPVSKLNLQRRMHPDVADLMRATLYPFLEDHPSTSRLPVAGMAHRTFWLDHQELEDAPDLLAAGGRSYSNTFECEMISEFVRYLLNTNDFDSGDITVLVPYSRQLGCLKERLIQTRTCSIVLSDKDKEGLAEMGFLADAEQQQFRSDVEVLRMVRLATIDGFQGEEAKVIILSTVRSNLEDRVGFLKTTNRINVACSRARNGFYIVGNSTLLRTVNMWESIVADFQSKGRIGSSFITHCSRHPHLAQAISRPRQFQELTPCSKACNHIFDCGHKCQEKCHEPALHSRMRCGRPCNKIHPECGHQCTKICGEPCGNCFQTVSNGSLACGHMYAIICADVDQTKDRKCTVSLGPVTLSCGHSLERLCSSKHEPVLCNAQCEFIHQCGHRCGGKCHECQENYFHSRCVGMCAKQLPCGHVCPERCHPGPCPECEQPCIRSCEHGKGCRKPCHVICDPCVQGCLKTSCTHGGCSTICSLPCCRLPCNEPCPLLLPCYHICPGLCGERCATVCLQCATGQVPHETKIFLPCGHDFNVAELDSEFGLDRIFELSTSGAVLGMKRSMAESSEAKPQCPHCAASCDNVQRYRHFGQFQIAANTIERLYQMFGRKMDMFAKKIRRDIEDLDSGFKWFCKSIELGPLAGQQSAEVIKARMLYLISTQTAITRFRDKVVPEGDIDRTIGLLGDSYTSTMPSLPFKCRFGLLSLHCRFGMLREATKIIQFVQEAPHSRYMNLLIRTLRQSTITEARERIEDARVLVAQCQSKTLRRLEAEALIIKVCFVKVVEVLDAVSAHQQENVHKWLQQADELVSMYPNSAGLLKTSLESVKKYWRGEKTTAELWTPETRNFWEKWGRYEVGSLIYCKHGHPYPKTVLLFRDCPECGRFFDPTAPALQPDYETQLNREKFLEHLRRMMGTH